jgi:hypothetical protein
MIHGQQNVKNDLRRWEDDGAKKHISDGGNDGNEREDYEVSSGMGNRAVFYMGVNVLGEHYAPIFRVEQIETVIMYQITTRRYTQEDRRISQMFES